MNLDLLFLKHKQIQIGLPLIWTGYASLKRHTLIKFLKGRPIFKNTRVPESENPSCDIRVT